MKQTLTITDEDGVVRVDKFLASKFPEYSRAAITKLFDLKLIKHGGESIQPGFKLKPGAEIEYDLGPLQEKPEVIDSPVLYEDDNVIVVDKPAGIISHARGKFWQEASVASFIRDKIKGMEGERGGIVHRLDRATSGVMICAKNEAQIPFRYELQNWTFAPNVEIHLDQENRSTIDLPKLLSQPDNNTLIYICGPAGFNHWVKETAAAIGWPEERVKTEAFSIGLGAATTSEPFELVLHKSGKTITVEKELTIIDALLMNNIKVDYSCLQGTCGTCVAPVLKGNVDHRDAVLSEEEKQAGDKICLCVSRARGEQLTVDI